MKVSDAHLTAKPISIWTNYLTMDMELPTQLITPSQAETPAKRYLHQPISNTS